MIHSSNPSQIRSILEIEGKTYTYYSLKKAETLLGIDLSRLPYSKRIVLENVLRTSLNIPQEIHSLFSCPSPQEMGEINFFPARVLMQDFTGVPALVDLASMREAMQALGKDPQKINPMIPVDLVIDHSIAVDSYGQESSFQTNREIDFKRNKERYTFLKWGQQAFENFRLIPPGRGICHQINLEYLAQCVWTKKEKEGGILAYPDTLVGTDSHTTMVNALGILGWGVGGIEAEAAMLGQPLSLLLPKVVGVNLKGKLAPGIMGTDLVLTLTHLLRTHGVVGKFVEFFGDGLPSLNISDRATIANMAPEYGATCGFFPVDQETLRYLHLTGRSQDHIDLIEVYMKAQDLWYDPLKSPPVYDDLLTVDLGEITPTLAGPKRPQDKINLADMGQVCRKILSKEGQSIHKGVGVEGQDYLLHPGDVVIAALTSCTNTSNPSVMIGAGLLARKALKKGLKTKPWVKTSLAPGSQVVTQYLKQSGLLSDLEALGFYLVGYGCTTCIGNSGPLDGSITQAIEKKNLMVASVISGNRNFEGRIHPHVKLNYLASPPLVVAYALAGTVSLNIHQDPLGQSKEGIPIYLKDIWPTPDEIQDTLTHSLTPQLFKKTYESLFTGDDSWQRINSRPGSTFLWDEKSTYIKNPPYFKEQTNLFLNHKQGARILALLGDSITTDHISPAGHIKKESPAGTYLLHHHVEEKDFNSYGARRGNHEVMIRGTFANIRLMNEMTPEQPGGYTRLQEGGEILSIYEASKYYHRNKIPLVIIAGKEYGTGSSRDWAAKGPHLLGVKAVIAESFERIHRSNLIGMGILPLTFIENTTRKTLNLQGFEEITFLGLEGEMKINMTLTTRITFPDATQRIIPLLCRIETERDLLFLKEGGILAHTLTPFTKFY